jgi:CrcB protein
MRRDPRELAAIFVGGMAGALARVWVSERFTTRATFLINVTGAAILAYAVTRLQERLPQSQYRRPFIGTGFCGALTTFSTMQIEILNMLRTGSDELAIGYAAASVTAGYLAIWITSALVRRARVLA